MQDDPSQYRVPILKLSDILKDDGQKGTSEDTDTAVTGMSWHTVESPTEDPPVDTAPNPAPAQSPKKHFVLPLQSIASDALDEPTPHPIGERATAGIRATALAQEVKKEPLPPSPPPIPTPPRYEPAQELPDFSRMNATELTPEPSYTPKPHPRPAKDVDLLDIWDRPAAPRGEVVHKPVAVTPSSVTLPEDGMPLPNVPRPNTQRDSVTPAEHPSMSGDGPQSVPPSPTTAVSGSVTTHDVQPNTTNGAPDIWEALDVGKFTSVKPALLRTVDAISATPPQDASTTVPATKAQVAWPQNPAPELLVEKQSPLSIPVPTPPAPAPTEEASNDDLSDLLNTLALESLAPVPRAPTPPTVIPSPVAPMTDTSVHVAVPTPPVHAPEAGSVLPAATPTPKEEPIPVIPLGTDLPDMWSASEEHHTHTPRPVRAPTPSSPAVAGQFGENGTALAGDPLSTSEQNVPSSVGRSNLSALREKVMKESIGKPGEIIAAPTPEAMVTRNQEIAATDLRAFSQADTILGRPQSPSTTPGSTHTPSTEHAQAISEIASKLNALQNTPIDGLPTFPTTPVTSSQGTSTEQTVSAGSTVSDVVPLMRTFKQDVQQTVLHNKTSVVDMISANEKQRSVGEVVIRKSKGGSWFTPTLYVLLATSALLLIGAVGVGIMIFLPANDEISTTTYFTPDATTEYDTTDLARAEHIQELFRIRDEIPLREGFATQIALQEKVVLPISGETETLTVTTHRLLRVWEVLPPDTLDRSLTDNFMFGYLSLDKNYPFLILESNYFQGAFSGMLDWEQRISAELDPIFPTGGFGAKKRDASTESTFTPTSATTTEGVSRSGLSAFEDITVANVPARILRDTTGNTLLLWSMPDDRIVIASNEEVLRRIIDRMEARSF